MNEPQDDAELVNQLRRHGKYVLAVTINQRVQLLGDFDSEDDASNERLDIQQDGYTTSATDGALEILPPITPTTIQPPLTDDEIPF